MSLWRHHWDWLACERDLINCWLVWDLKISDYYKCTFTTNFTAVKYLQCTCKSVGFFDISLWCLRLRAIKKISACGPTILNLPLNFQIQFIQVVAAFLLNRGKHASLTYGGMEAPEQHHSLLLSFVSRNKYSAVTVARSKFITTTRLLNSHNN